MKKSLITRLKSALCAVGLSVTLLTGQAYTCYAAATAAATAAVVVGGAVAISLVLAGLGLKSDGGDHPRFNDLVGKIAKNADVIKHTIGVGQAVEDVTKRGVAAYIKDGITYIPEAFAKAVAKAGIQEKAFDGLSKGDITAIDNDFAVVNGTYNLTKPSISSSYVVNLFFTYITALGISVSQSKVDGILETASKCDFAYFTQGAVGNYNPAPANLYLFDSLDVGNAYNVSSGGAFPYMSKNSFKCTRYTLFSDGYISEFKNSSHEFCLGKSSNQYDFSNIGVKGVQGIEAGFENTGSVPKQDGIGDDVSLPGNWAKPADIDVGLDTPIKALPIDIGTSAKAASLAIPQIWTPRALAQTYGLAAGYGTKAIPNVPAIPRAKVWGGDITLPKDIPIPAIPGNPAIPQEKVQNPTAEDTPTTPTPVPDTPIPAAGIPNENNFMLPDSIKEKFPFCIPFDMAKAFQKLSTSGREAPKFDYKLRGVNGKEHYEFKVDLSNYDSAARVLRTGLYIVFVIGLAAASVYLIKH